MTNNIKNKKSPSGRYQVLFGDDGTVVARHKNRQFIQGVFQQICFRFPAETVIELDTYTGDFNRREGLKKK